MRFFPRSLQLKVIANVLATSLLVILLFGSLIFSQIGVVIDTLSKEKLLEQAQKMASFIEYDWRGNFDLDLPRRTRNYYTESASSQYAILNTGGKVLFQSDNFVRDRIKDTLEESGKHYFDFTTEDGKHFLGLKYDYLFEDKIYPIYVIEEETEFSESLEALQKNFLTNILIYGIPLLILQALLILIIFRKALKPIIQSAKDARKIKYDTLSYRLNEQDVPGEILPLIHGVNNSLARLERSVEAQKFFIANAAHELRTPIAILKARIASLHDEKEVYLLNEDLRNINHLIGQMLDISRLDIVESQPKTTVNLNEISKRACEDMGPLFIGKDRELSLEERALDQRIEGNEDTLFRALLNLLENALKHTPEKTPVDVIVDEAKITVRDYGPPIPDAHKTRIFDRFEKLPGSLNTNGSGLGLAIVKKATEIHGGTVNIESRPDGNDFVLDLSGAQKPLPP